jgi:hypothetical protein
VPCERGPAQAQAQAQAQAAGRRSRSRRPEAQRAKPSPRCFLPNRPAGGVSRRRTRRICRWFCVSGGARSSEPEASCCAIRWGGPEAAGAGGGVDHRSPPGSTSSEELGWAGGVARGVRGPTWAAPGPLSSVAGDPDRHRGWLLGPSSVPAPAGRGLGPRMFPAHRPGPRSSKYRIRQAIRRAHCPTFGFGAPQSLSTGTTFSGAPHHHPSGPPMRELSP